MTYLDDIKTYTPKDWEAIEACAKLGVFFYDGPGVILPSGRRCTGDVMRALVAEAGYDPLESYVQDSGRRTKMSTWEQLQEDRDNFKVLGTTTGRIGRYDPSDDARPGGA